MSDSVTSSSSSPSRAWAFWVSLGLWIFASWQLFLLPSYISCFMSLGIPTPEYVKEATRLPFWTPLMVGIPFTFAAALFSVRRLGVGVALLALLAAICAHWTSYLMQLQLHTAIHRSRILPPNTAPRPTAPPTGPSANKTQHPSAPADRDSKLNDK
jgi:hypothetical protein